MPRFPHIRSNAGQGDAQEIRLDMIDMSNRYKQSRDLFFFSRALRGPFVLVSGNIKRAPLSQDRLSPGSICATRASKREL